MCKVMTDFRCIHSVAVFKMAVHTNQVYSQITRTDMFDHILTSFIIWLSIFVLALKIESGLILKIIDYF